MKVGSGARHDAGEQSDDIDEQPTLRERQAQQVATEIRLAFVDLVNSKGPNGFSLRDVATAAGVSERTLYRYYPGRDEIVQGINDHEFAAMENKLEESRQRLTDLSDPETVAKVFEIFEEYVDFVQAADLLRLSGYDKTGTADRTEEVRRTVARNFDIAEEAAPQLVGLIRVISSSAGWIRMTSDDVGLDSREAGYAAQWALEVLIDAAQKEQGRLRPRGGDHGPDRDTE
jgi:AcrR family transcriptional regulator